MQIVCSGVQTEMELLHYVLWDLVGKNEVHFPGGAEAPVDKEGWLDHTEAEIGQRE